MLLFPAVAMKQCLLTMEHYHPGCIHLFIYTSCIKKIGKKAISFCLGVVGGIAMSVSVVTAKQPSKGT